MSYIDIAIIVIVALSLLIGAWRGTGKSLINLACFLITLIVCYLISGYCLRFLMNISAVRQLAFGESFSLRSIIGSVLEVDNAGVVAFLCDPLLEIYMEMGGAQVWGATTGEFLSVAISLHIFTVIMVVLLYSAIRILVSIVGFVLKIIFIHAAPTLFGRLAGAVFGAAKGVAVACVLLYIVSVCFPFGFAAPVAEALDKSTIAPKICEYEYDLAAKRLYTTDTLELVLSGSGFERQVDTQA